MSRGRVSICMTHASQVAGLCRPQQQPKLTLVPPRWMACLGGGANPFSFITSGSVALSCMYISNQHKGVLEC